MRRGTSGSCTRAFCFPNGVRFSPDHAFLMVADTLSRWVWSFSVAADGSLANGVPFFRLEIPDEVDPAHCAAARMA